MDGHIPSNARLDSITFVGTQLHCPRKKNTFYYLALVILTMRERFPWKSVNENKNFMTDFVNKDNGWFRSTFLMQNSCGQPDLWREEGRTGYCPKSKVWKQTLLKCQGRMFWWERPQNKGNAISQNLKSGGAPRSHFLIWAFDSSTLRALWYIPLPLIISISGTS